MSFLPAFEPCRCSEGNSHSDAGTDEHNSEFDSHGSTALLQIIHDTASHARDLNHGQGRLTSSPAMTTFVLVHGGTCGALCWNGSRVILNNDGMPHPEAR